MSIFTRIIHLVLGAKYDEEKVCTLQEDFTNIAVKWVLDMHPGHEVRTLTTLPLTRMVHIRAREGEEISIYMKEVRVSPEKNLEVWERQSREAKEALRRMKVYAGAAKGIVYIYRNDVGGGTPCGVLVPDGT